jgi:hypothetical protein
MVNDLVAVWAAESFTCTVNAAAGCDAVGVPAMVTELVVLLPRASPEGRVPLLRDQV